MAWESLVDDLRKAENLWEVGAINVMSDSEFFPGFEAETLLKLPDGTSNRLRVLVGVANHFDGPLASERVRIGVASVSWNEDQPVSRELFLVFSKAQLRSLLGDLALLLPSLIDHAQVPPNAPMTDRTYGRTKTCAGCRYWSEMLAQVMGGGPLEAMCLAPKGPLKCKYTTARQTCAAWASGHYGAVDEPGEPGDETWRLYEKDDAAEKGKAP